MPESLLDRSVFVAEAFARNEPARIKLLVSPDSGPDIPEWIRKARPNVWKENLPDSTIIDAIAEIMVEDRTAGSAMIRTTFVIPPTIFSDESRSNGKASKAVNKPGSEFHLILIWTLTNDGT